ncbi:MAG: YaeQ family protein [Acidobacteriota bacterium]
MALTATIHNFDIDLADSDRGVYETLALRVARHPSESEEYLVARVLAYCLEYGEGIGFSSGISDPDDPTIAIRDLTGVIRTWIDIGTPEGDRLHKAGKVARRVVVYCHKDPTQWLRQLAGARMHRADALELYGFESSFIKTIATKLARRMAFALTVSDRQLLIALDDGVIEGSVTTLRPLEPDTARS